jgi:hypothetical protein
MKGGLPFSEQQFQHLLPILRSIWPEATTLLGMVLFGSRVKFIEQRKNADWDIGVIYSGEHPHIETPENWDLFLWSVERWQAGFALQVEIAKHGIILYDPDRIIEERFTMIREKILPYWGGYLKRF